MSAFWHKADMLNALTNLHFWGQSGHGPTAAYQSRFKPQFLADLWEVSHPATVPSSSEALWGDPPGGQSAKACTRKPTSKC